VFSLFRDFVIPSSLLCDLCALCGGWFPFRGEWPKKNLPKKSGGDRLRLMTANAANPTNEKKIVQLQSALAELLGTILRRGFFGTAGVEVSIQDGTIQHVRCKMERIER
jgi:hypothetical protein